MWHMKELLVLLGGMWRRPQWLHQTKTAHIHQLVASKPILVLVFAEIYLVSKEAEPAFTI
jgi:hypothetical protein